MPPRTSPEDQLGNETGRYARAVALRPLGGRCCQPRPRAGASTVEGAFGSIVCGPRRTTWELESPSVVMSRTRQECSRSGVETCPMASRGSRNPRARGSFTGLRCCGHRSEKEVPIGHPQGSALHAEGDISQAKRRSLKLMLCFQSSTLPTRLMLAQVPL